MSDNSRRCLYPFVKIGLVQRQAPTQPAGGGQSLRLSESCLGRSAGAKPAQRQSPGPFSAPGSGERGAHGSQLLSLFPLTSSENLARLAFRFCKVHS